MYHIVFIHSSVDGPLGCFQVLAVANEFMVARGEGKQEIWDQHVHIAMFKVDNQ